jgi:hypothetical protein
MKKILLILLTTIATSFQAQSYKYLGDYTSNGTPKYLEIPGDVVSQETIDLISNSLPESYPVPDYNPQYISAGYDTDIKISSKADIWVTFVAEGAGFRNVLGYYTYDLNTPLTTAPNIEDITIIFPNVSALGSGGGLHVGDKVKIGTFEAGTGIGWVLLANAWSSSNEKVGNALWNLYSNPILNPESDEDLQHHNVLLADPENERIILGFEDIRRDYSSCDNDFNDAIFYVTANPYSAIVSTNFADVTESSNVTSAYDGGLESNGSLADLIAKRNFKRKQDGNDFYKKTVQNLFDKSNYKSKSDASSLIDFLPETGMYNTEVAKVSSPDDLLGITNAKEIFSVDYYQGKERVSAVLATATEGKIYDHSKMICDRLNSSSLEDIRTVKVRGHKIISSKIKRASGETEYTLSFSIKMDSSDNELFSFWNIDQYPAGNYNNYQIWGSSYSQVFSIANFIIDSHTNLNGLVSTNEENILPNVFVKSGSYSNGVINLNIVNKTGEKFVNFIGNIAETEVSDHVNVSSTFDLSGEYNEVLVIETGVLFDIGFSLKTDSSEQKDALYLADGPWGVDYLDEYATITKFDVNTSVKEYSDDYYEVNRNAEVIGEVKGNVNLFRHILPGDQSLDVSDYESVNFLVKNTEGLEVVVMQDEDRVWENRIRYTIPFNLDEKAYTIPFTDFIDGSGEAVEITNIKTIVFSVIGDHTNFKSFSFSVNELSFSSKGVLSIAQFDTQENTEIVNFPNPFSNFTTIVLPSISESVQIQVFDLLGRVIDEQKINTNNFSNKVNYNAPKLNKGIYKYRLLDDNNKRYSGSFMIK